MVNKNGSDLILADTSNYGKNKKKEENKMAIGEIFNFIITNKISLIQAYLALVGFASLVIKLTPTVSDDLWLKKYLKFAGKFIALNRK